MKFNDAIIDINNRPLTDFYPLEKSKGGFYCCPICGSGTGAKGTGALKLYKNRRVYCHAGKCFTDKGEDTLGALRRIWNNCSTVEALEKAGYILDQDKQQPQAPKPENKPVKIERLTQEEPQAAEADYTAYYLERNAFLLQAPEAEEARQYLQGRGITEDSIKKFCIGYDPECRHPKAPKYAAKRIIIPRTKGSYVIRAIDPNIDPLYKKLIVGTQKTLFNARCLKDAATNADTDGYAPATVIVEGELDAISIMQAEGIKNVIGIGTINNTETAVKAIEQSNPEGVYIVALDNDENGKGQEKQTELCEMLQAKGIAVISADTAAMYGSDKDANATLLTPEGKERCEIVLYQCFSEAINIAEDLKKKKAMLTGSAMLDSFLQEIQSEKYRPFSTGMPELDRVLEGGFCCEELIVIGGAPGAGKTTFTMQLAEKMAEQGGSVLYFNLEMSRQQLLAKILSRRIYQSTGASVNALAVLQGFKWNDFQRETVIKALKEYAPISERITYNPEGCSAAIEDITAAMENAATVAEAKGEKAPIVVIDYLHLITSKAPLEGQEIVKKAVKAFKDYAIKHSTTVLLITAFNRDSNKQSKATMESGRDSSAIEYTADRYISINYTKAENQDSITQKEIEELQGQKVKDITVKILKQRLSIAGKAGKVRYNFYGASNYFAPISTIYDDTDGE